MTAEEIVASHTAGAGVPMYRNLIAWQKAIYLTAQIYELSRTFPKEEIYGLTSQLRRAAVSVPSNIAEGQGRRSPGEVAHFLAIARGSLLEIETQILVAEVLGYVGNAQVTKLLSGTVEVMRLINGLINSTAKRSST